MERLKYNLQHNKFQETKFHYVYITTNLVNDKQYVGDHSTFKLKDGYKGSGDILKQAFKIYGKKNFKKEILAFFSTKQDAFNAQEKYIQQYKTLSPNGYNVCPNGGLGFQESFSEDTKAKMKKNHADYSGEKHPLFGTHQTDEAKRKSSIAIKAWFQTEEGKAFRIKQSICQKNALPGKRTQPSPFKGKKRPVEIGLKISAALTGRTVTESTKQKNRVAQKKRMQNPELRERQRDSALKQWKDEVWKSEHIGENHPMFNKHHSLETREQQSKSHKKRYLEQKAS
jgi:group I intron endonuclease